MLVLALIATRNLKLPTVFLIASTTILLGWIEGLHLYLKNLQKNTCHIALLAIRDELLAWWYDRPPEQLYYHPLLETAIIEQRRLGWRQFLEGLM